METRLPLQELRLHKRWRFGHDRDRRGIPREVGRPVASSILKMLWSLSQAGDLDVRGRVRTWKVHQEVLAGHEGTPGLSDEGTLGEPVGSRQ